MSERCEEGLIQQLVAQPAVEALNEGVLLRLAGRDVVPLELWLNLDSRSIVSASRGSPSSEGYRPDPCLDGTFRAQ
jgi:hypothetical protein